jgi:hypothetical protein
LNFDGRRDFAQPFRPALLASRKMGDEVKERVEFYLSSLAGPSWSVIGSTLPFLTFYLYEINLLAQCVLCTGQTYRYSPEYSFSIFSQQIYLIIFLDFL